MAQWMDSIVQTYIEVWNGASPDLLDGIARTDVIRRSGSMESTNAKGIDALKRAITGFRVTFPDTTVTVKERSDEESYSLFTWEFNGTNTGPGEFPPTGKAVTVTGATLLRYRDGKMAEEHVYFDNLGFLKQLGLA